MEIQDKKNSNTNTIINLLFTLERIEEGDAWKTSTNNVRNKTNSFTYGTSKTRMDYLTNSNNSGDNELITTYSLDSLVSRVIIFTSGVGLAEW